MKPLKVLDLFSGIGGFSLGLERAGMETIAFCEIEPYPRKVLEKHWPNTPIFKDVRKLDGKQFRGTVELICGGFPCQPFSVAGKQRGKEDDRHLWPEMLRLVKEIRPTWVIGENVAGFIRMALDDVLLDLEAEGYTTQSLVIPACAVGAVHRRNRVWIIGHAEHNGHITEPKLQSDEAPSPEWITQKQDKAEQLEGASRSTNESCLRRGEGSEQQYNDPRFMEERGKGGRDEGCFRKNRNDFKPIRTPVESPICHRDDGLPDRVARLKALGNAVVPQIPELIGRAIMEIENEHAA
ncbi:MAG: DNA cytosine methyltransferase [Gammaproteobacteria bacterium]|nr:DNA cytosine methyltransferase [Gammaproteobacteria bacterium]